MIIGTAGHIDHGKTALVRALTGVDTDRLQEEKKRGISIDLGFAYLPAPDGRTLAFVDVPGHERFIRNMLAGATGIDFALLVVAADDGVMPQTREHLAILDLLGVGSGIVALTKSDLVSAERLEAARRELRDALGETALAKAAILPVSAVTGAGLDALRDALFGSVQAFRDRASHGRFRLTVDRSFTLAGAGTVVTGTVLSGTIRPGDHVLISPAGLGARVRGIHAQNQPALEARAGERCAVNLAGKGVSKEAVRRGDFVLDPALHAPTERIDATLRLLARVPKPMRSWTPVRLHHAATEVGARVVPLSGDALAAGAEGFVQLVLEAPVAAAVGDRFVVRDTSAQHTLGGGRFLDLRPPARKRRTPERLQKLAAHTMPRAGDALRALLQNPASWLDLTSFTRDRALAEGEVEALVAELAILRFPHSTGVAVLTQAGWTELTERIGSTLEVFHARYPDVGGLTVERLRLAVAPQIPSAIFSALLNTMATEGRISIAGAWARLAGHAVRLTVPDEAIWARMRPRMDGEERFRPPRVRDMATLFEVAESDVRRILKLVARRGEIYEVAHDHFFLRGAVSEVAVILGELAGGGEAPDVSVAQVRDRLDCGRKVAMQILEFFDRHGATARRGDVRRVHPRQLDVFRRQREESPGP